MNRKLLKAPFPYFGGKSRVSSRVWERFGNVQNYIEPFFGSGVTLLTRPIPFSGNETVNDKDHFLTNFWRSVKKDPQAIADLNDWPLNEADFHARHYWMITEGLEILDRNTGDPTFCDVKIAGWWLWGINLQIGSGWCVQKNGGWSWNKDNGWIQNLEGEVGVYKTLPSISRFSTGRHRDKAQILAQLKVLSERLRFVEVCCGDWSRVLGESIINRGNKTAIFFDPPYSQDFHSIQYREDDSSISGKVRNWAIENGENPSMRIAVCGYEGEHTFPENWSIMSWKSIGGYGNQSNKQGKENSHKERIWFSPYCINTAHGLFNE